MSILQTPNREIPSLMRYKPADPDREWEWENTQRTHLISTDGVFEISQDPVYGYWKLYRSEDTMESLFEHMVLHVVVIQAEQIQPVTY